MSSNVSCQYKFVLKWRHNGRDCISNHQSHDCLPKGLFRRRSKKTSKLRVTGLCAGTGEFPAQMASNAENVCIWWRHHVDGVFTKADLHLHIVFYLLYLMTGLFQWTKNLKHGCLLILQRTAISNWLPFSRPTRDTRHVIYSIVSTCQR